MIYQISPYPRFAEPAPHAPNWTTFLSALPNVKSAVAKALTDIEQRLGIVAPLQRPLLLAKRTDVQTTSALYLAWYLREQCAEMLLTVRSLEHYRVQSLHPNKRIPEPKAIATILWAAPWWRLYMRGMVK